MIKLKTYKVRFSLKPVITAMNHNFSNDEMPSKINPEVSSRLKRNLLSIVNRMEGGRKWPQETFPPRRSGGCGDDVADDEFNDNNDRNSVSYSAHSNRHSPPPLGSPPPSDWLTVEAEVVSWNAVNTSHIASDFVICSPASMSDGVIDIVVLRAGITRVDLIKATAAKVCKFGFRSARSLIITRNGYLCGSIV